MRAEDQWDEELEDFRVVADEPLKEVEPVAWSYFVELCFYVDRSPPCSVPN